MSKKNVPAIHVQQPSISGNPAGGTSPPRPPTKQVPATSPRAAATVGMVDNLAASRVNYGTSASHATVQAELAERVEFNDRSIFEQLEIDKVDPRIVQECSKTLQMKSEADIAFLKDLVRGADKVDPKVLEYEAIAEQGHPDPKDMAPEDRKSSREKKMYDPLERIFGHIQAASLANSNASVEKPESEGFNRVFRRQSAALTPDQDHTLGFPHFIPDFTLIRKANWDRKEVRTRWRDRDGFIEVKPSARQHPYPAKEGDPARPLLTQTANYARLHLSARPFCAFSVSIMIFGNDFCVCIFDRTGGRVSPKFNMWADLDTFIRVIWSMTRRLTDVQLGRDPSVSPAPPDLQSSWDHPAWIINPVGSDPRRWCTVGAPIWSSLSLFGRGTFVWYVREFSPTGELSGPVMILKSAWRSSQRDPESSIYQTVRGSHPGLAKFVVGADVVPFPGSLEKVTTHYLRQHPFKSDDKTKVLHRIVIGTTGKPIWMYDTEEQLIDGLISALEAHKFLWDQKILHRDISAGNVLLSHYPEEVGAVGFITDLDLARMEPDAELKSTETVHATSEYGRYPQRLQGPMTRTRIRFGTQRGDVITGTLQFMSRHLLEAIIYQETTVSTAADDVESFFWVLVYAIFRKLLAAPTDDIEKKQVLTHFRNTFGRTSVPEILAARGAAFHDGIFKQATYCEMVSYPLRQLLLEYRIILSGLVPTIPLSRRAGGTGSYGGSASTGGRIIDEASVAGSARYNRFFSHEGMIELLKETRLDLQMHPEGGEGGVKA
ncbi:hypothetical protein C8Q79DRAFT_988260 [Trametes meyenii]|nr:hypothetical protein C8Q79DRAFT_988260 [Trametes meyenii]